MKKVRCLNNRNIIQYLAVSGSAFLCFFFGNQLIYGQEQVIEPTSETSTSEEVISIDETFTGVDGNVYQITMTGLNDTNAQKMVQSVSENFDPNSENPVKVVDESFYDAEKWCSDFTMEYWNQYDDAQCWAASTSNLMWISGWAEKMINPATNMPFSSEDEVFEYISRKFTDKGSDITVGIDWFFMGEIFPPDNAVGARVVKPSYEEDGLLKDINSTSIQTDYNLIDDPSQIKEIERVSKQSENPVVAGGSIGELLYGELLKSTHAVTIAGIISNPNADTFDQKYKGIILIDSDNDGHVSAAEAAGDPAFGPDDMFNPEKVAQRRAYRAEVKKNRPNSYTVYPLSYEVDALGTPYWAIHNYSHGESYALYRITALELPSESTIQKGTETEGTKNIFTNVDLTLDVLFTTDQTEVIPDPFSKRVDSAKKTIFESGEAVNIMYYLGNRSNTPFENDVTIEWVVTRNKDGSILTSGSAKRPFDIYHGVRIGDLLEINPNGEKWYSGDYTLTLYFNKDRAIEEAYYLNNTEKTVVFTITGNDEPPKKEETKPAAPAYVSTYVASKAVPTGIHHHLSLWISLLGASISGMIILKKRMR